MSVGVTRDIQSTGIVVNADEIDYDDFIVPPPLGADNVQEAIDALKSGGGGTNVFVQIEPIVVADGFSKIFSWTLPMTGAYVAVCTAFTTAATSGVIVNPDIATVTLAGFTMLFSNAFDGEVHVYGVLL